MLINNNLPKGAIVTGIKTVSCAGMYKSIITYTVNGETKDICLPKHDFPKNMDFDSKGAVESFLNTTFKTIRRDLIAKGFEVQLEYGDDHSSEPKSSNYLSLELMFAGANLNVAQSSL